MNERARGAFLGLAVGDCLGAPVEGMPAWEIKKRFGRVTDLLDPFEVWVRRPERGRLRGLHTDDTQQAWILADVLLKRKEIVADEVAASLVSFARARPDLPRGVHRGTGRFFRAAVDRLVAGTPVLEAGEISAGNGAAMRVAPVGLVLSGDATALVRHAVLASAITHRDARAVESAAGLAALIGALVGERPPAGLRGYLEAALEGARQAEALIAAGDPVALPAAGREHTGAFREVLAQLMVRVDHDDELLMREIADLAGAHSPGRRIKRATDGFALASVTASIAFAARAATFREAVENAVNAGEDADSVGAMTGALAGARFGAGAIPAEWLSGLVGAEALSQVADALGGGKTQPPDQEALEETWTRLEHAEGARRAQQADEEELDAGELDEHDPDDDEVMDGDDENGDEDAGE